MSNWRIEQDLSNIAMHTLEQKWMNLRESNNGWDSAPICLLTMRSEGVEGDSRLKTSIAQLRLVCLYFVD